jgi:ATP-dependent 26S proteasome regulatory subunit
LFDPALLRPGRVDLRLMMGYIKAADLVDMVQHTFECRLEAGDVDRLTTVCREAKWTASKVQEILQGVETVEKAVQVLVEWEQSIAPCA